MSAVVARSFLRSATSRTVNLAAGGGARPTRSMFRVSKQGSLSNRIFRSPVEMSRCMESMLPYHTTTALALLTSMLSACPRTYGWTHEDENGYPYPVAFKVTKFVCGGFTIGMSTSRIASDGWGGSQFFQAELASGKSEPSVKLVCMRERLVGSITTQPMLSPMDEASAAVSPFLPATDVTHECFKVDGESIRRLKMSLVKGKRY